MGLLDFFKYSLCLLNTELCKGELNTVEMAGGLYKLGYNNDLVPWEQPRNEYTVLRKKSNYRVGKFQIFRSDEGDTRLDGPRPPVDGSFDDNLEYFSVSQRSIWHDDSVVKFS